MRRSKCQDCKQGFDVPSARGILPKRCPSCRRAHLSRVERIRQTEVRNARLPREAQCRDCGTAVVTPQGRGRAPERCPSCKKAWTRTENLRRMNAWRAANAEHVRELGRASYQRNISKIRTAKLEAHYLKKYGITRAERDQMLVEQQGRCLICQTADWGKRGPSVDHCHTTKQVRGLLCMSCNTMIGLAREDPVVLQRAIEYLDKRE